LLLLVFFTSCKPEPPPDPREAFIGTYIVNESCGSLSDSYSIEIRKWGQDLQIYNLYNVGEDSNASVDSDGQLRISMTYIGRNSNGCSLYLEEGSGSLRNNNLIIGFTIRVSSSGLGCQTLSLNCFVTGQK